MARLLLAAALVLSTASFFPAASSAQRRVDVGDADALTAAFDDARPGDEIVLAAGNYGMRHRLDTRADGTAAMPITVRAEPAGSATVTFTDATGIVEGFVVSRAYWVFEDLVLEGQCDDHSRCEHAWHVVGDADFTVIRNNEARDFNAQIKANGNDLDGGGRAFPDDVLVEANEFYSRGVRMTANPVTPIDVVGGRRWILRANYIHDFAKGMGNTISYAAFLKGNSRDGIIERNLVVCEALHSGQVRLGLSFGGGGSNPDRICEDSDCSIEHQGGVMRNNLIAHCPADVGVYVNECVNCEIRHNTLFDTTGIDLRFGVTTMVVDGNVLDGRIRDRDGATSTRSNNLEMASLSAIFTNPAELDFSLADGSAIVDMGMPHRAVTDDYCGQVRDDGSPDLGAIEYLSDRPCDTSVTHPGGVDSPGEDAGPGTDAGPGEDAGTDPTDGGAGVDAGTRDDAGGRADGGTDPSDDGGCGCRTPGRGSAPGAFFLVALMWFGRRRLETRT